MTYRLSILFITLLLLAACGNTEPEAAAPAAYTVVEESQVDVDAPIPAPEGEVILTITGDIDNTNVDDTVQFDRSTLENMRLVEMTVPDEQAEGGPQTFQGVLVSDLLAWVGASSSAEQIYITAVDGYEVAIPMTDIDQYPVLLATRIDNEPLTLERFGPTRFIYPYDHYEFDASIYDARWIWSVETISVE